jgi:hypothetical protein
MTYTGSLLQLGTFAGGQTLNVTTSGNVGIGTTSPFSLLQVTSGTSMTTSGGDQASNATIEGANVAIGANFTSQLAVLSNSSIAADIGGGIAFGSKYSGKAFAYYAAITGVSRVDIAVLIGGQELRIYQYLKDKKMEDKLIRAAVLFWNKYILTNTPPAPKTDADTAKLFPKGNGLELRADDTILQKIDMLQDLKAKESFVIKEMEHLQIEVKNYMQDAELLIDNAGHLRATWKNRKGSKRLDTKTLAEEHNEIYKQYLKEGEAYRVFALKQ